MIYRLDLDTNEIDMLKEILNDIKTINTEKYKNYYSQIKSFKSLNEMTQKPKKINYSAKKTFAAQIATQAKTKRVKEKIEDGIKIQKNRKKKFTFYSISKISGVSLNTVKKYIDDERLKSLNDLIGNGFAK